MQDSKQTPALMSFSGIGSWPGTDLGQAQLIVRDLCLDGGIPYLVELPALGPSTSMIGRTAGLLADLPVEYLHGSWRLSAVRDTEAQLSRAYLGQGLDILAELFEGYVGPLKVQATGPWTLAAWLQLRTGEPVLSDAGAVVELHESLREGLRQHVADVQRQVPGATVLVQLDEPSLPTVLAGAVPNRTRLWQLPAVPQDRARAVLEGFQPDIVHCCAPVELSTLAWAPAIAVDVCSWSDALWEEARDTVTTLWAGGASAVLLLREWPGSVVATRSCGLAFSDDPVRELRRCRDVARELSDRR